MSRNKKNYQNKTALKLEPFRKATLRLIKTELVTQESHEKMPKFKVIKSPNKYLRKKIDMIKSKRQFGRLLSWYSWLNHLLNNLLILYDLNKRVKNNSLCKAF